VDRYAILGVNPTRRNLGISNADFNQFSGLHDIPSLFFSSSLLNSQGEIDDKRSSSYFFASDISCFTFLDNFEGVICHQIHV